MNQIDELIKEGKLIEQKWKEEKQGDSRDYLEKYKKRLLMKSMLDVEGFRQWAAKSVSYLENNHDQDTVTHIVGLHSVLSHSNSIQFYNELMGVLQANAE